MIRGHQNQRNDDSYVMGDEELQIVSPSSIHTTIACSESTSASTLLVRAAEKKKDPSNSIRNTNATSNSSTGCISILNPVSSASRNQHMNNDSMTSEGSFDVCKEFGYKYEYTEDDSSTSTEHENENDNENANASMPNPSSPKEGGNSLISMLGFTRSFIENEEHVPTTTKKTTDTNASSRRKRGSRGDREQDNDAYKTYILGKSYHPINDYHAKRDDEANLFWLTYRCDFLEIKPYGITSDAGWGCMLRSAQMLFAQVMRMHFKGREWRAERSLKMKREDSFLRNVLSWFADYPCAPRLGNGKGSSTSTIGTDKGQGGMSGSESWYSLHNMVAAGCARYDVLPGEWFGPGTACHVLRDLVQLHRRDLEHYADETKQEQEQEQEQEQAHDQEHATEVPVEEQHSGVTGTFLGALKVYVAPEGSIYRSDLKELLVTKKREEVNKNCVDKDNHVESGKKTAFTQSKQNLKETDPKYHHPLYEAPIPSLESKPSNMEEWNASLLILVPLRLGLKQFNASSYKVPLAHMLSFPQSVGFIGGSPRHALWFYGANSDGSKVYGLDPHTVQRAPRRRKLVPHEMAGNGGGRTHEIIISDEYLRSIHCPNGSAMDMTKIDPSLALGFYCCDRKDYESFEMSLKAMKEDEELKKYPELFTISDAKPDYSADLSSAMMVMMSCSSPLLDGDIDVGNRDEDDEYIML